MWVSMCWCGCNSMCSCALGCVPACGNPFWCPEGRGVGLRLQHALRGPCCTVARACPNTAQSDKPRSPLDSTCKSDGSKNDPKVRKHRVAVSGQSRVRPRGGGGGQRGTYLSAVPWAWAPPSSESEPCPAPPDACGGCQRSPPCRPSARTRPPPQRPPSGPRRTPQAPTPAPAAAAAARTTPAALRTPSRTAGPRAPPGATSGGPRARRCRR